MSLAALDLYRVQVPLKKLIRHASFERASSENLVVRATLDDGSIGYGEGVPRPYVTGETVETAFQLLARHDWARLLGKHDRFESAVAALERLEIPEIAEDPRGMNGNAARCALELALLDAYGQRCGRSLGDALALAANPRVELGSPVAVRYSGAITAESTRSELISALKMRLYGFHQVKIKVGANGEDESPRLRRLRRLLGSRMDLRVDANEAYDSRELLERVRQLLPARPSALEQPLAHSQLEQLAELRPRISVPIMLDESLCGLPDAHRAIALGAADLFNIRLSKCGGIGPSLRILALARQAGLGVQLGCHPGETSILSAAGRHFASRVRGLRYVEGSYDRHVLARNVTHQDVTFKYGGRAQPIVGPGLGIRVDPELLASLTVATREIRYD